MLPAAVMPSMLGGRDGSTPTNALSAVRSHPASSNNNSLGCLRLFECAGAGLAGGRSDAALAHLARQD